MRPLLFCLPLFLASAVFAQAPVANAPVTHAEFDKMVHDYLVNHPETLIEAMKAMEEKQVAADQKKALAGIKANHAAVYDDKDTPVVGDPKGDVTVVEFFDYNCGVCKAMFGAIDHVAASNTSHVRLLLKEFPIFGPQSDELAKLSLAVYRLHPAQYYAFHSAMMTLPGHADRAAANEILNKLGLSVAELQQQMTNPDFQAEIDRNHALGEALGIKGTPTFLIGDDVVPHGMTSEDFAAAIEAQRGKASAK